MTVCFKGKTNRIAILLVFSLILVTSCRKDNSNTIGADFIGLRNGFNIFTSDSAEIICFSSRQDSVPTQSFYYYSLGDMNDPLMGKTKANIFAQFSLPLSGFSLNGGTIDSVFLQLKYVTNTSFYGNLQTPQQISVYELKEPLFASADSNYFSNRNYQFSKGNIGLSSPIGLFSGVFDLLDSVYDTVNSIGSILEPHLRIKLSNAFVSKLQKAEAAGAFQSDAALQSYIYGLAIVAQTPDANLSPGQGAITYFNLRHTISGINVYYHNASGSQKINFAMPSTDMATNQFSHGYTIADSLQPFLNTVHRNQCFVQSNSGIKTRILLPNIHKFAGNNSIAIMGAELVITAVKDNDYPLPLSLRLNGSDSLGRNIFLDDFFETYPLNYTGGIYDAATNTYRFNIIRYVQRLINTYKNTGQNVNYGMNLTFFDNDYYNAIGAGRVVLNTNRANKNIVLHLSYSMVR
ncbi:MAG: DUF4270 family protein [Bacteroidia bacterium]